MAPTLGKLESTAKKVWETDEYTDQERPTVFMGLYGFPDFYALWRHKGIKEVFWCGTDILHFEEGYWLEDEGKHFFSVFARNDLAMWLSRNCGHWVENEVERDRLWKCGILARIQLSFLGDINKFSISFKPGNKLYTSVSGNNFEQYGWDKIQNLALNNPKIEFFLYGNTIEPTYKYSSNVTIRGRVSKERMNKEIMDMQGSLRLTEFDGASEIIVKAMLMGQYCFSLIDYPFVNHPSTLHTLPSIQKPNFEGREWWRENLNNFPWT